MQKKNLYKYEREAGKWTVSTVEPEIDYIIMYRLIADKGMTLNNGTITTPCVDIEVEDLSNWNEIPDSEDEATEQDYQNALNELGVDTDEA